MAWSSRPWARAYRSRLGERLPRSVERGEEIGHLVDLLLRQVAGGGHDAGADFYRADDRRSWDSLTDVSQFRAGPVVAVLADLVAGEAAGAGDHLLAGLELRGDLHVDLGRRPPGGAEIGEVGHRRDRQAAG